MCVCVGGVDVCVCGSGAAAAYLQRASEDAMMNAQRNMGQQQGGMGGMGGMGGPGGMGGNGNMGGGFDAPPQRRSQYDDGGGEVVDVEYEIKDDKKKK